MAEWFAYGVGGAMTAFGAALAANVAPHTRNPVYGCLVLMLIYGLHWSNRKLEE